MPDLNLTAIGTARARVADGQDRLREIGFSAADAQARHDVALARGDDAAAAAAAVELTRLAREQGKVIKAEQAARKRLLVLSDRLVAQRTPEDAVATLAGNVPVLMLPARLETRFSAGGQQLDVRVFPDQVHVTAHDPALTEDELAGLTWYWERRWPAPEDQTRADEAWAGLVARFRPGRAAFLVRAHPPTNLGSGASPRFDNPPMRASRWSAAARAALLPDRWCVLGFRRDGEGRHSEVFRVWGRAVPDTLAAGPGNTLAAPAQTGGLPDDPALRWLRDPAAAVDVGMLVRVRQADCVAGFRLSDGVDRLVALGVDWTLNPQQAADAVQAHLQAHADEGRLAFVPQGVPTNSTGATRSGFSTDPAAAREVLAPHQTSEAVPGSAGSVTAGILGLSPEALDHVPGAHLREQRWQGALLQALWPATGGYYLTEMLDPVADDPTIGAALRRHVVENLRASGPVPTLRVGAQPYGVLPVTHRTRYRPSKGTRAEADIHRVAGALRGLAEPLVADVPRLASVRQRADVDDVLLALLARTPVPWSLTFRQLVGPVQRRAMSVHWDRVAAFQRDVTATLLAELGCYTLTLLSELTHDAHDHPLEVPMVLRAEEDGTWGTGYLREISHLIGSDDGRVILDGRQDATALLEAMLACAAVRDLDAAGRATARAVVTTLGVSPEFALMIARSSDRLPYSLRVEEAPVAPAGAGGGAVPLPQTPAELSRTILPALTGSGTLAQTVARRLAATPDLAVLADKPDDPLAQLAAFGHAIGELADAPADQLEWAFRGTLDLYSTRLDAWITSLATARLKQGRSTAPRGVHVGGWGVVEDLRPDSGPAAESLGFVHAPSLAQAASTAVLRSARLSHAGADGQIFDLDLTSARVRHALRILEGVASGQRLAALLGYRFERMLQDRDLTLARWILPLRLQCPLRSDRPEDPTGAPKTQPWESAGAEEPVESVAARDVVDGVALLARWAADGPGLLVGAGVLAGDRKAVGEVLDAVASIADAVSDVLVSEAVHQATSGNLERAGAALAAHDRQGPPPDPQFVRTPRAGQTVAHRVGVWLAGDETDPAPGWAADVRSTAEPRLDRWIGIVLGDPDQWTVRARLVRRDPGDPGAVPAVDPVTAVLADLDPISLDAVASGAGGMSALSVVLSARRPGSGQLSELEAWLAVLFANAARSAGLVLGAHDRVELAGEDLATLRDLAAWAAEVIGAVPLGAADLTDASDLGRAPRQSAVTQVAEARRRADAVLDRVRALRDSLDRARAALAASPADTDRAAALARAMLDLAPVAGLDAIPDPGLVELAEQATALSAQATARIEAIAALPAAAPAPGITAESALERPVEDAELVRARAVVRILLGNGQPFLPVLRPTDPARLAAPLAARDELLGGPPGDPNALAAWLHRAALVRPTLDPLAALLMGAEAAGADVPGDLRVVQLPHQPDRTWVALPFGPAGAPVPGTVGLVLHAPDGIDPVAGGAGVMIDAWSETIPESRETTAVAFHYDAPGARAPQTMLLAVHPDPDPTTWDMDALVGSVHEAMDLARVRTLGPKELAAFSTFLPALYLPDAYSRDTPGLHLLELLGNVHKLRAGGLVVDHILGKGSSDA